MHVSKITIARLFNLGNYEHVRFEIAVDVKEGEDAQQCLSNLEQIIEALNPKPPHGIRSESELQEARRRLAAAISLTPDEFIERYPGTPRIKKLQELKKQLNESEEKSKPWIARRAAAQAALNNLGGKIEFKDAKHDWNDDEDCYF